MDAKNVPPAWLSSIPPVNSGAGNNTVNGGGEKEDWDAEITQSIGDSEILKTIGTRQDLNTLPPGLAPAERKLFRRERRLRQEAEEKLNNSAPYL